MTRGDAIGMHDRPARDPRVAYVVLDGESVLFHEEYGNAHLFNPTATLIWTALDGDRDVDTLVRSFTESTGAPLEVIERDVLTALGRFAALGLLDGFAPDDAMVAEQEEDAP